MGGLCHTKVSLAETMPGQSFGFAEPLLLEAISRKAKSSDGFATPLLPLIATTLAVLLLYIHSRARQQPVLLEPFITLAQAPPHELGPLSEVVITSSGVQMPRFIYTIPYEGQHEGSIERLVTKVVRSGFHGLQIVGQTGFAYQPGVREGLQALFASGIDRGSLFIQMSFNPKLNVELFPTVPIKQQVETVVARSLNNLGLKYVDCLVLHSIFPEHQQTMELWRAMEDVVKAGVVRQLGIWNLLPLSELQTLFVDAAVKPAVVQQLFSTETKNASALRAWCVDEGIYLQSSWMLTEDRNIVGSRTMHQMAKKYNVEPWMLFFRFVAGLGAITLISREDRPVQEYLSALRVPLDVQDADTISSLRKRKGVEASGLLEGKMAVLTGLKARPELNGAVGVIGKFNPDSGRWHVRVNGVQNVAIRPENILQEGLQAEDSSQRARSISVEARESQDNHESFAAYLAAMKECAQQARWDEALSLLGKRNSLGQQPLPSESPKMVVLIASHIRNEARVTRLRQLLSSIVAQAGHMPKAFLASVSASCPELLEAARDVFAQFELDILAKGIFLYVAYREAPLSQFGHYASLVEPLKEFAESSKPLYGCQSKGHSALGAADCHDRYDLTNLWVLFTDDDDLWHPYRTHIYSQAINMTLKLNVMTPISVPVNCQNLNQSNCVTAEDVDDLMRNHTGRIVQYSATQTLLQPCLLQYWSHAVPLQVFLDFMLCTSPAALAHESCDYRFSMFMRDHLISPVMLVESPLFNIFWMYFHRQHDEGRVSTGMWAAAGIKPQDIEIARSINGSLRQSYDKWWSEAEIHSKGRQEGEDRVVRVCAELRRTVERHLAVYGAMLPIHTVVEGYLHHERLKDTLDESIWSQLISQLAAAHMPLVLPGPNKIGAGLFGRGSYQNLTFENKFWEDLWIRHMLKESPFPHHMKQVMAQMAINSIQEEGRKEESKNLQKLQAQMVKNIQTRLLNPEPTSQAALPKLGADFTRGLEMRSSI